MLNRKEWWENPRRAVIGIPLPAGLRTNSKKLYNTIRRTNPFGIFCILLNFARFFSLAHCCKDDNLIKKKHDINRENGTVIGMKLNIP